MHPYLTQQPLFKLAKTLGIPVTAYSSFGPQGYYEIGMGTGVSSLFENEVVRSIAERVEKCELIYGYSLPPLNNELLFFY